MGEQMITNAVRVWLEAESASRLRQYGLIFTPLDDLGRPAEAPNIWYKPDGSKVKIPPPGLPERPSRRGDGALTWEPE